MSDYDEEDDDFMLPYTMDLDSGLFVKSYRAFSSDQLPESNLKKQLEHVLLPPSALEVLSRLENISYPMVFKLLNQAAQRSTFGGVLEFSAAEGVAYLPFWMFKQLGLSVGGFIEVSDTAAIPRGTFTKIQPQSVAFLDISDPRAVLEVSIRNYTCLSKGDIISFKYNDKIYEIAILEVLPDDGRGVVLALDTDLQVDFAPPIGYEEQVVRNQGSTPNSYSIASSLDTHTLSSSLPHSFKQQQSSEFAPFSGRSNRIASRSAVSAKSFSPNPPSPSPPPPPPPSAAAAAVRELQVPKGTIVFPSQVKGNADSSKLGDKFTAFSGKSNKLQ